MATIAVKKDLGKLYNFTWEGKDKGGRMVRGEMRAGGQNVVMSTLRSDRESMS
jgi:type IV pilus assembly protein PilC